MIITRHPSGSRDWVLWRNPATIIATSDLASIPAALEKINRQVDAGRTALGFLAYEAGRAFDSHFMAHPRNQTDLPLLWFALFDDCEPFIPPPAEQIRLGMKPAISVDRYRTAVATIKRHIAQGDTYQVNYTFPLTGSGPVPIRSLFFNLVQSQPSPYAMLIETDEFTIASASPELFFALDGDTVRVEPMKGTCPRGPHPALDRMAGERLHHSEKNRAENIMIVDMMRNDLGRIAIPGTVCAESLFQVTPWPTLWQMTSSVTAKTHVDVPSILRALFPCASITGAPKLKTSEIIAELEPSPRGIYTGTLGCWMPGRRARFAVAIRTLVHSRSSASYHYGVGSGIVWDSNPEEEFRECLLKARILSTRRDSFRLLETLRWDPACGYQWLDAHLRRMKQSAAFFDRDFDEARIRKRLEHLAGTLGEGSHRIRILLAANGALTVNHSPLDQPAAYDLSGTVPSMTARLDTRGTATDSPFLYHKTTRRQVYHKARLRFPDVEETLLINPRGELMEFTNGNLVLRTGGKWLTPDLASGLLPGVFREKLIADGLLRTTSLTKTDLENADDVYFINSVRGWRKVAILS